jgi:hypothetical protein
MAGASRQASSVMKGDGEPPYNQYNKSFISDETNVIIRDVQFLLDFAIVALYKTGTTTEQMPYLLPDHPARDLNAQTGTTYSHLPYTCHVSSQDTI